MAKFKVFIGLMISLPSANWAATPSVEKVVAILKQGKGSQFAERLQLATQQIRESHDQPSSVFLSVAKNKMLEDSIRYQALMGIALSKAQLSDSQKKAVLEISGDRSWMMRLGLAKSAGHFGLAQAELEKLLGHLNQDISLVVRSEVLESLRENAGRIQRPVQVALIQEALDFPANYVRNKPQVVPYKALSLIDALGLKEMKSRVHIIAERSQDTRLKSQASSMLSRF